MTKIGELDLLPVPGWSAYPTYFISAGGLGSLILSWLMYYVKQNLPERASMEDFSGARFLPIDTAAQDPDDLPPEDWAGKLLFRIRGDLNQIIDEVKKGLYPGINDFYEDTDVAREARKEVGDLEHGAGTTRPFGRIGFFFNWEAIFERLEKLTGEPVSDFDMRFGGSFRVLTPEGGGQRRHFFIVSSLAGGTGSSCFLDIAATLRHLQRQHYPNEQWFIIGVFTLAEVLAVDVKVDQELKRKRMKANTYAALKELNHFLSGESFGARYGRDGKATVLVTNTMEGDSLFDLTFLVDTPNQDNQPLSGRMEVAQFLAQSLLLLGMTPISERFFNRHVDSAANLVFRNPYPPTSPREDVVRDQQKHLFSSLGLSTLSLPVPKLLKYANYHLAGELLTQLASLGASGKTEEMARQVALQSHLTERDLDLAFTDCLQLNLPARDDCFENLRQAENPMEEIRRLVSQLETLPGDEIRRRAGDSSKKQLQTLFPSGEGELQKQLNKLVAQGQLSLLSPILREVEDRLTTYRNYLNNELQTAHIQSEGQEVPGFLSASQTSLLQTRRFADLLNAMEQSWSDWGSRIFRIFFRNRFVHRYEGELWDLIDLLHRIQHTANILLIWPAKIDLVDTIVSRLRSLQEDYSNRQNYFQRVRAEIEDRLRKIRGNVYTRSRFREVAITPELYFERIFLPELGDFDRLMERLTTEVRNDGLPLGNGQRAKLHDWVNQSVNSLADELYAFCEKSTSGPIPAEDTPLEQSNKYYQVGLNHSCFLPAAQPSPFDLKIRNWKNKANVSVLFHGFLPEALRYVIAGCRTRGNHSWDGVLNLRGVSLESGGPPNQATLLSITLGFPISSLAGVKAWYQLAYVPQRRQRWPLHLFRVKSLDAMMEPYQEWAPLPTSKEAQELFDEALKLGILYSKAVPLGVSPAPGQTVYFEEEVLSDLPKRVQSFFYDYQPRGKSFDRNALIERLRRERSLFGTLKAALLREGITDEQREKILENKATIEEAVQWSEDRDLILKDGSGQYAFAISLYDQFAASRYGFCETFFSEGVPGLRHFSPQEFVSALTRHEPLCRWVLNQVLRALGHPTNQKETLRRLRDNQFQPYLADFLTLLCIS